MMPRYIVKLGTKYVEWSTVVDAPVTRGMTRDELKWHLEWLYRGEGMLIEQRLARADINGTSLHDGETAREAVVGNRAGPRESPLTYEQLVEWAESGEDLP